MAAADPRGCGGGNPADSDADAVQPDGRLPRDRRVREGVLESSSGQKGGGRVATQVNQTGVSLQIAIEIPPEFVLILVPVIFGLVESAFVIGPRISRPTQGELLQGDIVDAQEVVP